MAPVPRPAPDAWLEGPGRRHELALFLLFARKQGSVCRVWREIACAFGMPWERGALVPDAGQREAHKGVYRRLYNVAKFEWSAVVPRTLVGVRAIRAPDFRGRASHFVAGAAVFSDGLMWHRRVAYRPPLQW